MNVPQNPILIYHRGRHGIMPDGTVLEENTLPAFERAILEGAQMVEFDVWERMQVVHDPGQSVTLTVPEVLTTIAGRCAVNIEIKSPAVAPELTQYIVNLLEAGVWSPAQIILSAFHHQTALYCKRVLPALRVGVVTDGVVLPEYIAMLRSHRIDTLHVEWANLYMDVEAGYGMRSSCEEHGMQIWVWTVNTPAVARFVTAYGVAAIFTDRPDLLGAPQ